MEIIKSLLTGMVCGAIFCFMRLPIPAPTVLAGIAGIVGIFLGYLIVNLIKGIK